MTSRSMTKFDPKKPARLLESVQLGRVRLTDNVPNTRNAQKTDGKCVKSTRSRFTSEGVIVRRCATGPVGDAP